MVWLERSADRTHVTLQTDDVVCFEVEPRFRRHHPQTTPLAWKDANARRGGRVACWAAGFGNARRQVALNFGCAVRSFVPLV